MKNVWAHSHERRKINEIFFSHIIQLFSHLFFFFYVSVPNHFSFEFVSIEDSFSLYLCTIQASLIFGSLATCPFVSPIILFQMYFLIYYIE